LDFDTTKSEIFQQKTDTNSDLDKSKNGNCPSFGQLHDSLKSNVIDRENKENCNNFTQATTENTNKINNELEKEQRKQLIMGQLESLAKQKEELQRKYSLVSDTSSYNLAPTKKPVVLNLVSSLASKKIMTKISSFSAQVANILTKEQKR